MTTHKKATRTRPVKLLPHVAANAKPITILKAVAKAIREEPLRYDQNDWIQFVDDTQIGPSCGTVCCVAGWVAVLKRSQSDRTGARAAAGAVHLRAQQALGLTDDQAQYLFAAGAIDRQASHDGVSVPAIGSKAYAELGIRHIEGFMRGEMGYTGPKL